MEDLIFEWDENHSYDEERYYVLGLVDVVLYVVYTIREEGKIRLISARRATDGERSIYGYMDQFRFFRCTG